MAGPDPAVAALRSAVRAGLEDLPAGAVVLVACSGGADSLALAAATAFVAPRLPNPLRAGAVVVDHGWNVASARVAAEAAHACRGLGLDPVEVVVVDTEQGDGGPEARARTARYVALEEAAVRHGADAVLLGHTLDDQAETVLLGLARGSGGRSLAGMARRRGILRRPFLDQPRTATRRACEALALVPWDDPSNADPAYARARVRAVLGVLDDALGPGLVYALGRTADLLREDADALDALAADLLGRAGEGAGVVGGEVADGLDVAVLAAAPDAVRRRALLQAIRAAGAPAGALGRRHVLAVDAFVMAWRGQGPAHLPGGVVARRECGRLLLGPDELQQRE